MVSFSKYPPPLASDELLTILHSLLKNVLQTVYQFEISFSNPNTEFNSDPSPCDSWAFPTMNREFRGKKFRTDQRSAARFREVGEAL